MSIPNGSGLSITLHAGPGSSLLPKEPLAPYDTPKQSTQKIGNGQPHPLGGRGGTIGQNVQNVTNRINRIHRDQGPRPIGKPEIRTFRLPQGSGSVRFCRFIYRSPGQTQSHLISSPKWAQIPKFDIFWIFFGSGTPLNRFP